jgi:2-oxoisovalerate dehydrogenase E1 component
MTSLRSEELVHAYRVAARSRAVEERIVRLVSQGRVKFAIWGAGEEVHGTATALAFEKTVDPRHFGLVGHYRSGALCSMWCELRGHQDFTLNLLRQQFSRATDPFSGGRQMVYHLSLPEVGILPIQSPVGMQLGKAAGYAQGFVKKGVRDAVVVGVIGDGTAAEGDLHDAMNAASVWSLPLLIMVTDNSVAISTKPAEGRGIKDFASYARAFGVEFFQVRGTRFDEVFEVTSAAASAVRSRQRPALLHVTELPRLNGHSSAGDYRFRLDQTDPLLELGRELVQREILTPEDVLERIEGQGADFYAHHRLGKLMEEEDRQVAEWMKAVAEEPEPEPSSIWQFVRPPFPEVAEPDPAGGEGETAVTYAGALRAAHKRIFERHLALAWGEDIGGLGGVMQATAGLKTLFPDRVLDSPLNEPLIVGTATGAALHPEVRVLCEIQFGDYSLNAYHWFVHLGNLYWSTFGRCRAGVVVRMPTDPFGGGALYHSMSVDGFFSSIPGLVIVMPSTSYDAYGLLMTAAEYGGPVLFLEPKWCYRRAQGPRLPGEPQDEEGREALRNVVRRGEIPGVGGDLMVPFQSAALRRAGRDVTVAAWGRAVWTAMDAAARLAQKGVEAEVLDLRTLVPLDVETLRASVTRTGRLVIAHEDRPFHSLGRHVQGVLGELVPGLVSRVVGMKEVPGVGQSTLLEEATTLSVEDVEAAVEAVLRAEARPAAGWSYVARRFLRG